MQEIETEYLQGIVSDQGKTAIKLAVVPEGDFRINEIVQTLELIEKEVPEAEFFVYCPNLFMQVKIDEADPRQGSRAAATNAVLHTMHLDTLPYSSVIVIAPKGAEASLEEICERSDADFEVIRSL